MVGQETLTQPIGGVRARPLLMAVAPLKNIVTATKVLRDGNIVRIWQMFLEEGCISA